MYCLLGAKKAHLGCPLPSRDTCGLSEFHKEINKSHTLKNYSCFNLSTKMCPKMCSDGQVVSGTGCRINGWRKPHLTGAIKDIALPAFYDAITGPTDSSSLSSIR